jgi:salicylate 1-O-methyltransferase
MSDTHRSSSPAAMEGRGACDHNSAVRASGSAPALPLSVRAASGVALPVPPDPVANYGAPQRHNSLEPMIAAIRAIRKRTDRDQAILLASVAVRGE